MIFVLLPAYNEGGNIRSLLESLDEVVRNSSSQDSVNPSNVHAVVVNDGSSDSTLEEATNTETSIKKSILNHNVNGGLAKALNTGLTFALEHGQPEDIIITMDADGTHHPRFILDIVKKINEGFGIVIASRFAQGGREFGVSGFRKLLSHGAGICYKTAFPTLPIRDFSCGYRGFTYTAIQNVMNKWGEHLFETKGFACTGELMLKTLALMDHNKIAEIPFELHYEAKEGESKMSISKTIVGTLQLLWRARGWMA